MFDLKAKQTSSKNHPAWVEEGNEKVKKLFQAIVDRVAEIEGMILNNEQLTPSQYKIRKSTLCKDLGYSDSYINKHKALNAFVESEQRRLNRSVRAMETSEHKKKSAQNKVSQMRRDDLINEVAMLRKSLSQRQSELYVNQLNHLIDSGLSDTQAITSRRISHLESELNDLREKNIQLEANNKRFAEDLVKQLEINAELKEQISDDTPHKILKVNR